jgi:hypothetical protein
MTVNEDEGGLKGPKAMRCAREVLRSCAKL